MQPGKVSDTTILTTGILAWLLLAFASLKLSVIYAKNPTLAYLLAYNISSFIFLIYFIGYFKTRFTFKYLVLLVTAYNAGINVLHLIYNKLFLLASPPAEFKQIFTSCVLNIPLMVITWALLRWFIYRKI